MDGICDYQVLVDKKSTHRYVHYKRVQKSLTKVHYEQGINL